MTVNQPDKMVLQMYGFTEREINELDRASDPSGNPQPPIDLTSPVWRKALLDRQTLRINLDKAAQRKTGKGLTNKELGIIIDNFYKKSKKRSPWDWLKIAYKPKTKADFAQPGVRERIRALIRTRPLRFPR